MAFEKATDEMSHLLNEIVRDMPKVYKGNKQAAQRVRVATIELSKLSKKWRKLSMSIEKKKS
ncbi:MAG: Histone H1-like protein HC1 [Chlamydiia bacterium]|nr:Histone H1-like protein HC1 [Chlamydiia bacterium]MCH9619059.1 Histone H1-like protein HC1 [Chlamydiia bacterium]